MTKVIAVYPGSFDPPTNGHRDIIVRASRIFAEIVVAVTDNHHKNPTFPIAERYRMLKEITAGLPRVRVEIFSGLLVKYLRKKKARVIIRGLRAVSDFEYEFQMALMNRRLAKDVETVFLIPAESYTYLSSSVVRELSELGADVRGLVSAKVARSLKKVLS
jgi:pantetheine-phosphate adenylyltransferase